MRTSGVLLPLTSLPGPEPMGCLGRETLEPFLDALVEGGFGTWQILPVPPESRGDCPYAGSSAFAIDPLLLSLDDLGSDGVLDTRTLRRAHAEAPRGHPADEVPWPAVHAWKRPLLEVAGRAVARSDVDAYLEAERGWLPDWALWWALARSGQGNWQAWPGGLRDRDPSALAAFLDADPADVRIAAALQLLVQGQWDRMRERMRVRGLSLMGDMPIYVNGDGADVWTWRRLFLVDRPGEADLVAGCPPDAFNAEGQRWDNPVFDWAWSAATDHRWWRERFRRLLRCTDVIRVDHFRGFVAFYAFPEHGSPREGRWLAGPGASLFEAFARDLGEAARAEGKGPPDHLPMVVEDLGHIDAEVLALRDALDLPGTKVLQFGFDGSPDNPHHPDAIEGDRWCACTGTHDLPPAAAWYEEAAPDVRARFDARSGRSPGETPAQALVRLTLETSARLSVIPLQDLQGLGARARINVPGTITGNWRWRATLPDAATLTWCRALHSATGRLPLAAREGTA